MTAPSVLARTGPDAPGGPGVPGKALRAASGVVAAGVAVGVGHLVASFVNPTASPVIAVGSALIDAAPTPAKTFAVRLLGNYDKPVLIGAVGVALLVFAAVLGLVAWSHRRVALVGIALLGVVGAGTAVYRGDLLDAVPSLVAGAAGVAALLLLVARSARSAPTSATASTTATTTTGTTTGTGGRRGFLAALGLTALVAALAGGGGVVVGRVRSAGALARRGTGLPAPTSPAPPLPAGAQIPGMTPFTTPVDSFYRVDISLVTPQIDASSWSLTIDGMVDSPLTLTYDELLAMPLIERDITLTCVSNEVGGSYVSSGRWLGVPFSAILEKVGVQAGADQVYSYSLDSGYTASTPLQAVSDGRDAMIAVGLDGQPLADARGYPARMIVPGLFGFVANTKWLERIEFTTYAKRTAYWTERKWATDGPILTQSRIDLPKSLSTIPKDKPVIAGVAWAQHRGITKVEVKIDDGPWQEADLAVDAGLDLWRQWSLPFTGDAGLHSATVRATDATGETQPEARTKVFPDGARGWHQIQFTSE
ncbi:molybdopterin-dependent oxidoreductase [Microlunatus antarcticus]|uniref:DMSO/TMAO reductase YedYZ molybdopterin-dependent catalytic subunit n=1 Tax=Microlunatus antarcticus TaxID=53388 RepID=A0A7W5P6W5_9ACTN|nr:molybdopterin-dependent oxidoreductase [Microlunatus antarcticus]MBB3326286.1 DMSO/TMAO reductase YedYZ molybdopterin-dependent catalytic subunit [Microlunatus antarcticus]